MSHLRSVQFWCRRALRSRWARSAGNHLIVGLGSVAGCFLPISWMITHPPDENGEAPGEPVPPATPVDAKPLTPAEEAAWRQLSGVLRAEIED